jgi:hypothetical protein
MGGCFDRESIINRMRADSKYPASGNLEVILGR